MQQLQKGPLAEWVGVLLTELAAPLSEHADCSVSLCADDCAGHGTCVAPGRCVCAEGWHGERCATSSCPGLVYTEGRWTPCSARGDCVRGTCVCEGDARGPACSFDAEVERRAEESRAAFAVPPRRPMPRS